MATIYINIHPNYDYSMAMIQGYCMELKQYVREHKNNIAWTKQYSLMIKHEGLDDFIKFVLECGCVVKARDKKQDEWQNITEKTSLFC